MTAMILTGGDIVRIIWLAASILFVIPVLSGIGSRIIISNTLIASALAIVVGISISTIKFHRLGGSPLTMLREMDPVGIVSAFSIVAFAILGVRTASAFYSGLAAANRVTPKPNKSRLDNHH